MSDDNIEQNPVHYSKKRFIAIGLFVIILLLLIPLPALLLDFLWALNLILVLLIFPIIVRSKKVNEISLLPKVLLVLTIFSLLIHISFARLILTKGEAFDGWIIHTLFSLMMHSGKIQGLLSGLIFFISLAMLTMMVFTKGCTRVSEVAARFVLDSCVCKHMAIDVEYESGTITGEEAIARRNDLQGESDFYGAMDGASKFISGYGKASLFLTAVSIIGGIAIGALLNGETIYNAMMICIPLSLCNGFLALVICLMESIIAGIVVTRMVSANETSIS